MNYIQESSLKYVPSKYSTHTEFKWTSSHLSVTGKNTVPNISTSPIPLAIEGKGGGVSCGYLCSDVSTRSILFFLAEFFAPLNRRTQQQNEKRPGRKRILHLDAC